MKWSGTSISLFLLATATLAFEINLTRLFSVAQFYHFAFMIVSIALLGYALSGTVLAIFPGLQRGSHTRSMGWLSFGTGISILVAYLLTNWLPFDSYSLLVDEKQVFILCLHYLALAMPFFFNGMALARLLSAFSARVGHTYATNLLGSACGCVIALLAPGLVGGEGMVTLTAGLAGLAAVFATRLQPFRNPLSLGVIALLILTVLDLGLRITLQPGLPAFALHISPYKSISYALQYPSSQVSYSRWNTYSRVDVISSAGIHSLPGLSYRYLEPLPQIDGLLVDGDDLNPIVQSSADASFTAYLPNAVAFRMHPNSNTLILEPRGGLDILTAFTQGSGRVTVTEVNPLVVNASPVFADQRLIHQPVTSRSFLQRTQEQFDVILLSLVSAFHPVQSGAYSLAEDYRYTLESFTDMLNHLTPGGVMVATRWLQNPPSEDLRLFALAVTAIETSGGDPTQQVVAFRGYNTATIIMKNSPFLPSEIETIREFAASRAFDLSYAPGIQEAETNQFNILPDSSYYRAYLDLLKSDPRQDFYETYPYDVSPPTDDHPFFGHFFKWEQTPEVLGAIGKAWLPFGGGGYFVILALLLLAIVLASLLVLLPVVVWRLNRRKRQPGTSPFILAYLVYFGLLGFAFLLVEIPLLQGFILYLGNPAYAVTSVLFGLLLFSGIGSRFSSRIPLKPVLAALTLLVLCMPLILPLLFEKTLGLPLTSRLGITILALAPLGFLMGIPFPGGIHWLTGAKLQNQSPDGEAIPRIDIPWIWAGNGAASVVSPILAALLALTYSFSRVLWVGAGCYAVALLMAWVIQRRNPLPPLRP